jgi:hypothetical protein
VAAEDETSGAGSRSKRRASGKAGVCRMKESEQVKVRCRGKRRKGKK